MPELETITVATAESVTTITLNRPERMNAFTDVMIKEITAALRAAERDPAARVVLLTGAGKAFCYTRIILPMAKPALIVIALQTLIATWNDFYGPLIYINSEAKMTLPLGLTVLRGVFMSGNQGVVLAGVILSLIVPLVFYLFCQRFLLEGITLSGLKG